MTRVLSRVKHDEVVRLVKAVRACGLDVARISFDGEKVDVIIGHSGEPQPVPVDVTTNADGPIREPQL